MKAGQIGALIFGILVIVLIASTGAFTEIIKGFTSAMGFYGFIIGICIVLMIIFAILGKK